MVESEGIFAESCSEVRDFDDSQKIDRRIPQNAHRLRRTSRTDAAVVFSHQRVPDPEHAFDRPAASQKGQQPGLPDTIGTCVAVCRLRSGNALSAGAHCGIPYPTRTLITPGTENGGTSLVQKTGAPQTGQLTAILGTLTDPGQSHCSDATEKRSESQAALRHSQQR